MLRRASLTIFLLMGLGIASSATGAVIDPGLQDAFKDKSAGELVRVMMLMDDFADLARSRRYDGRGAGCKPPASRCQKDSLS